MNPTNTNLPGRQFEIPLDVAPIFEEMHVERELYNRLSKNKEHFRKTNFAMWEAAYNEGDKRYMFGTRLNNNQLGQNLRMNYLWGVYAGHLAFTLAECEPLPILSSASVQTALAVAPPELPGLQWHFALARDRGLREVDNVYESFITMTEPGRHSFRSGLGWTAFVLNEAVAMTN